MHTQTHIYLHNEMYWVRNKIFPLHSILISLVWIKEEAVCRMELWVMTCPSAVSLLCFCIGQKDIEH